MLAQERQDGGPQQHLIAAAVSALGLLMGAVAVAEPRSGDPNPRIDFYGRVVDQDGKPLAKVRAALRITRELPPPADTLSDDGYQHFLFETATDGQGRFSLLATPAYSLALTAVKKEGYLLSPWVRSSYVYGKTEHSHKPDPNRPVQVRMWKWRGGGAKPEHGRNHIGVPYDGRPVPFDLVKNRVVTKEDPERPVADLRLSLRREVVGEGRGAQHRWALTVEVPGGGVALPDPADEFMFLAPDAGYEPAVVFESGQGGWAITKWNSFFVRGRDGKLYASVRLDVNTHAAGDKAASVQLISHHNTQGSRLMEFDYYYWPEDEPLGGLQWTYPGPPPPEKRATTRPTRPSTRPAWDNLPDALLRPTRGG